MTDRAGTEGAETVVTLELAANQRGGTDLRLTAGPEASEPA